MIVNPLSGKSKFNMTEASLRTRVKLYKQRIREIEKYLNHNPQEWGKFQNEFNSEVNAVFREIMLFEKENISSGNEDKVYKLMKIFTEKIKKTFVRGDYIDWTIRKPYGYAGDFKIIEDMYENNPTTTGVNRLFDNYYMMSAIVIAVRNRKNDFKRMVTNFVSKRQKTPIRIMDLASGPCREVIELYSEEKDLYKNVTFDCYDSDQHAIKFASNLLKHHSKINFIHENAARIAFRKDIHSLINQKYDLIYSTGLFDYFEERLSTKLIANLRKLLNPGGVMIISNVRDKYSNPSLYFMEWVGEWPLVYCDDDSFRNYFINAGFKRIELELNYEQQGILQYVLAWNKSKE
ncbi:MAG TPA: hypothetical protein DD723_08515 [Candidatus Omnitrophica bacterium]|nr:MAG: hypothetical protein A2Z81_00055 [Omnitrophica WOR_2 bacterium GWA2_45_18]OGX18684.1 MAG: hypothetical protein A2Y04_00515 [Omnitrophica WOR_2 bacterium GWC2_45_7]HBR15562.1 hypothetical protein [Candidatus Omnitrophota bacterium]